ncbi:hydrolase [Cryptosporidium bovis]|uniref:hydrolase n=1 Tax=Cryptosporidium bovis TaxID=310047 RepID=UPI00351A82A2|nr:hydrolase [Cryptosporidium bovis]
MCSTVEENLGITAAGIILFSNRCKSNLSNDFDPCFLLLKCSKNGHWSPPKGMAEEDEADNLIKTAYRETMEESGIHPEKIKIYNNFLKEIHYKAWNRRKRVVYYLGECEEIPEVTISDEHSEYKWAGIDEVRKLVEFESLLQILESAYEWIVNEKGKWYKQSK